MVISLVGMRFHVCVGILPHERVHPQALEIDLAVTRGESGVEVLDYRLLYSLVANRLSEQPLDYLEEIAASIADRALAMSVVRHVRVAVRKPQVLLDGPLAYAEVCVERSRD